MGKEQKKMNLERKWRNVLIAFCLFKIGFNQVMHEDPFILNWCSVLGVSKTEKQSLEHLSKQSVDDIRVDICVISYPYQSTHL